MEILLEQDPAAWPGAADRDLLGEIYTFARSPGTRRALGAFFTPMPVNALVAGLVPVDEAARVLEPSCGSGGMVIAAAREMRRRGLDPRRVVWELGDIDPVAVALAGVNAVVHDLGPNVRLRVRSALDPS